MLPSYHPLSAGEYQVALLFKEGYLQPEVADLMLCSLNTIKTYRARIYKKLGIDNKACLVTWLCEIEKKQGS